MSEVKKELKRFIVTGSSAVITDLLIYYILLNCLGHNLAKAISFLLGACVAFILNKYWTFERHQRSYKEVIRFSILYSLTLGANVLSNKGVLDVTQLTLLAFLVATGVSTTFNFIGQKWWVFK